MAFYKGCRENEKFVGNTTAGDNLSYLDEAGVEYRIGEIALDIHGKEIGYMRPLFINLKSYDKYNRIMQAQVEAIRRS